MSRFVHDKKHFDRIFLNLADFFTASDYRIIDFGKSFGMGTLSANQVRTELARLVQGWADAQASSCSNANEKYEAERINGKSTEKGNWTEMELHKAIDGAKYQCDAEKSGSIGLAVTQMNYAMNLIGRSILSGSIEYNNASTWSTN